MKRLRNYSNRAIHMASICCLVALLILPIAVLARTFRLQSTSIVPGATGQVKTGKDKNGNTEFTVEVKYLAAATALTPPKSIYMVWIQQKGSAPESQGALKVNDKLEGKFESSTPNKNFDLWITAESDPNIKEPSGPEVLRANGVTP